MTYFVSDLHGEYSLLRRLLEKISFSLQDTLYVCGDMIDKGNASLRLLQLLRRLPNVYCILGNHELMFLKYYRSLSETVSDPERLFERLSAYFPEDEASLDWETVDWLESLPYFIETEQFICVHAGIPLGDTGELLPPSTVDPEALVNDRRFKAPSLHHTSSKCVLFGHTPTDYICGAARILAYPKKNGSPIRSIGELMKVHLDTGVQTSGVLGCFCLENCRAIYVQRTE